MPVGLNPLQPFWDYECKWVLKNVLTSQRYIAESMLIAKNIYVCLVESGRGGPSSRSIFYSRHIRKATPKTVCGVLHFMSIYSDQAYRKSANDSMQEGC